MTLSMAAVGASVKPVTTWLPTDLGTALHVWYDADDASTFTEVSGLVSQWKDKSGNGRNLTQSTSTRRPARTTNTLNGRTVVTFTSDRLDATVAFTAPFTHYAVFKQNTIAANSRLWHTTTGPGSVELLASGLSLYVGTSLTRGSTTTAVRNCAFYGNGASSQIWSDGTQQGTTGNSGTLTIGTSISMGATGGGTSNYLDGYVAELLTVTGSMTSTDREKIEGYLAHKWGLTANLPSGHPYKTSAP